MEPKSSSPRSQDPASCPNPEPDQPIPRLFNLFLEDPFNVILQSIPRSSE